MATTTSAGEKRKSMTQLLHGNCGLLWFNSYKATEKWVERPDLSTMLRVCDITTTSSSPTLPTPSSDQNFSDGYALMWQGQSKQHSIVVVSDLYRKNGLLRIDWTCGKGSAARDKLDDSRASISEKQGHSPGINITATTEPGLTLPFSCNRLPSRSAFWCSWWHVRPATTAPLAL